MILNLFIAASLSLFYTVNVPVAVLREDPQADAEVVSQAIFSESVIPIEESGDWVKVEMPVDNYQGWIKKNWIHPREDLFLSDPSCVIAKVNRCAAHLYHVEDTIYGPILTLPFESRLEVLEPKGESNSRWLKVALPDGKEAFIQRGDVTLKSVLINRDEMTALSLRFLGLPYTWGGRSSFGYDCSGFVQMLYRQMGIYLPRDSRHQINWSGFKSVTIEQLIPGDLVFFGLEENKIRHVGMYLGKDQFIHATVAENMPYIRISRLSDAEWNGSGKFPFRAFRTLKVL